MAESTDFPQSVAPTVWPVSGRKNFESFRADTSPLLLACHKMQPFFGPSEEPTDMSHFMNAKKPVHEIRLGAVRAAIWEGLPHEESKYRISISRGPSRRTATAVR